MLPLIGIGLLCLLGADVFLTVFHAQGRGGPVNRMQKRLLWGVFRRLGVRRGGEPRAALLALGAPASVVITLTLWVAVLVVGYALIFYPYVGDFRVSPENLRTPWTEALYFSGYTAATLGFGDLVPDREVLRLLAPLEAFSGFALLSVSVTYLLAIYRELISMQTLATNIAGYFRAVDVRAELFPDKGHRDAVARWTEGVNSQLLHVLQAHHQYPILHYFRPSDTDLALPVQLGRLLELRDLTVHPSLASLKDSLQTYLNEVSRVFVPRSISFAAENAACDDTEQAHRRLLRYMRYR